MKQSRLKDRGVIKGIPDYRKHVYRFTDNGISYIKVQIFGEKYRPLFEKNIQAVEFCKEHRVKVPEILGYSSEEMIIHYKDVGQNVMDLDDELVQSQYIQQGLQEVFKLHSTVPIEKKYYPNTYIEKFKGGPILDEDMERIKRLLDKVMSVEWKAIYGPGVSDPTPSNMCFDEEGKVYLIDFDNFTMEVSFFESLGFIVGDYFFKKELVVSDWEELCQIIKNWNIDQYIDLSQVFTARYKEFWFGFISVYLPLYQDIVLNLPKAKERLLRFEPSLRFGLQQLEKTLIVAR